MQSNNQGNMAMAAWYSTGVSHWISKGPIKPSEPQMMTEIMVHSYKIVEVGPIETYKNAFYYLDQNETTEEDFLHGLSKTL